MLHRGFSVVSDHDSVSLIPEEGASLVVNRSSGKISSQSTFVALNETSTPRARLTVPHP